MPTITTSRTSQIIKAIVANLQSSVLIADPVRVYDGPDRTDQAFKDAIFIGFDGDWSGHFLATQIHQEQAYLGNTSRNEQLDIQCCAIHWSGDDTTAVNRDAAFVLVAAVETVLRTDPTLAIDGATFARAVSVGQVFQEPEEIGFRCRVVFTIHVDTFLFTSLP